MFEKNVRYAHVKMFATVFGFMGSLLGQRVEKNANGSFYQKMYKIIICSFLNSKHFIFLKLSCIF
ncbi:hypothetical protein WDU94_004613 [Cyamophila willieti]